MIIPDGLTLEELIGAMKAEEATLLGESNIASIHQSNLTTFINLAVTIKKELDRKADK